MIPQKGGTIAEEIKCYGLPYGAVGFVSHILTYWTILWLSVGRKPYMPWSRLSTGRLDLCLSFTQITITVGLASFTIVRCRSRWQFVLLAVWKLTMSATVGFWGIWASLKVIKNKGIAYNPVKKAEGTNQEDGPKPYSVFGYNFLTLIIYFLSMTVGLVGTISLVIENIHQRQVWIITAVFASLVIFFGLSALLIGLCGEISCFGAAATSIFGVIPSLMLVLGAFYCDWILAALAGNLVGVPSGDTAILYWTYFGAKRIPLFLS